MLMLNVVSLELSYRPKVPVRVLLARLDHLVDNRLPVNTQQSFQRLLERNKTCSVFIKVDRGLKRYD